MNELEPQSDALWQQQLNSASIDTNEQFWQAYEGLIIQARLLAKKKLTAPMVPLDYSAKRLIAKYWKNISLPELYYLGEPLAEDGFSVPWSLISTLFAIILAGCTLFMGLVEVAVVCIISAIGIMSAKTLLPTPDKVVQDNKQEIKVILEPQYLRYHFRNNQTSAYQTIQINYDWIAELREETEGLKLIGHKNQDTWQVKFGGEQYPVILPKSMTDSTYLKPFLQDLIRQKKQPKTPLIP